MMRVRSMENRVFSATANRIGREDRFGITASFRGESQVVDCNGELLCSAGSSETVVVTELDPRAADDKTNAMCADLSAEWRRYRPSGLV